MHSLAISWTSLCRSDGAGEPLEPPQILTSPPSPELSGSRVTAEHVAVVLGHIKRVFAGFVVFAPPVASLANPESMQLILVVR